MELVFFNTIWIYLFQKCLFGFRIDTSTMPFSIVARFGLFYSVDFWYNKCYDFSNYGTYGAMGERYDLIIPFLCDITFIKQI